MLEMHYKVNNENHNYNKAFLKLIKMQLSNLIFIWQLLNSLVTGLMHLSKVLFMIDFRGTNALKKTSRPLHLMQN
jgi:hypothetical protein